jgi:hypothetical protein
MSDTVPSSIPPSSVDVRNARKILSRSGFLHLLLREPPPSPAEVLAYENSVAALPTPSMRLFVNAEGEYRASPYWLPGQTSPDLDRELHLVKVMEGSVSEQDGWSPLIVDQDTNLDRVADALNFEVDRVRTIADRARERNVVAPDLTTGMRVERRVCPSVYDTLDDKRATDYLGTMPVQGLAAMYLARQGTDKEPTSSQRLTELENFVRRLFEIESRSLAPSTSCAELLPITQDADFVSEERACGTAFGSVMQTLLEERKVLFKTCKEAAQFTEYGWRLNLPISFEACSEVNKSGLDCATKQLARDISAGLGGGWRSERQETATERSSGIVDPAKMQAIRDKCDELSARVGGGSSAQSSRP